MKKGFFAFSILLFVILMACQKEASQRGATLSASKATAIKRGEPVVFTIAANQTVSWRVRPNTGVQINASGNWASIRFVSAGQYTVTGIAGTDSANMPVTDSNSQGHVQKTYIEHNIEGNPVKFTTYQHYRSNDVDGVWADSLSDQEAL